MKNKAPHIKSGSECLYFDQTSARDITTRVLGCDENGKYIIKYGEGVLTGVDESLLLVLE